MNIIYNECDYWLQALQARRLQQLLQVNTLDNIISLSLHFNKYFTHMIAAATAAQAAATVQKVSTISMVIKFCYVIPVHSFKKLHMHV